MQFAYSIGKEKTINQGNVVKKHFMKIVEFYRPIFAMKL